MVDSKAEKKYSEEDVAEILAKALALNNLNGKVPVAEGPPELSEVDLKLIDEGCNAYGIDKRHLFASNIDRASGEAILVTRGGTKVRFAKGDKDVEKLGQVRITGVNPNPKRRQLTGVKGKKG